MKNWEHDEQIFSGITFRLVLGYLGLQVAGREIDFLFDEQVFSFLEET